MEKPNLSSANEAIRINASDGAELKYWSKKFKVNKDDIRRAVKQVGDSLSAVTKYLELEGK